MIGALLYLQGQSVKNRTVMRIKRLRQPKYLMGFIVGAAYLYFYFYRYLMHRHYDGFFPKLSSGDRLLVEFGAAFILFVIVFLAWVVPHGRAALTFTEAEIAFLFPAPISRRTLIHFKLLRSQIAILFTTFILTLVTNSLGGLAWIHAVGWWLILSTLNLHFLGSSFALTRLMDKGITNWQRRAAILALAILAGVAIVLWARHTLPPFDLEKYSDPKGLKEYAQLVVSAGPVPYLLYPFRLVVRPYLSPDARILLVALPPALLLLALHYIWVVRSNVAFEEASIEASKRQAEKVAAIRAGDWRGARVKPKRRRAPFQLRSTGPRAVAVLWKNLISAGQIFTLKIWVRFAIFAVIISFSAARPLRNNGFQTIIGMMAFMFLIWAVILGPQLFRQDFRQDLVMADVLKSYPMHGWQIVLGELLGPALILTGIQWFLLIILVGFFPFPEIGGVLKEGIAIGAAIVMPPINLITLQIPNASVLLFPAWFLPGKGVSHGIEVTGQRLIFLLGQFFVFLIALLPAAGIFAGVFFLLYSLLGLAALFVIPIASCAAAAILLAEAAGGILLLGWLFQRFDVAAEQPT